MLSSVISKTCVKGMVGQTLSFIRIQRVYVEINDRRSWWIITHTYFYLKNKGEVILNTSLYVCMCVYSTWHKLQAHFIKTCLISNQRSYTCSYFVRSTTDFISCLRFHAFLTYNIVSRLRWWYLKIKNVHHTESVQEVSYCLTLLFSRKKRNVALLFKIWKWRY